MSRISYIGPMSETPSIVFLDRATLGPEVTLRKPSFEHRWAEYSATDHSQLIERACQADIVLVNKVKLTGQVIEQLPKLKLVAVAATGTDNVDLDACADQGVAVCNVRHYAATSVPEHILAVIFSLRRRLAAYQRRIQLGHWQRSGQFCFFDQPIKDLAGSTLGIVGTGSIATALAALAQGLNMRVLFHSLSGRQMSDRTLTSLPDLLQRADVISLNCPLTAQSENLINAQTLAQMKPGALLVNTARGAMVDMHALEKALLSGQIGGAGIDVCQQEPPPVDDPLMRLCHLDNVVVTPHSAWASSDSMQALADQLIDAVEAFAAGQKMNRLV